MKAKMKRSRDLKQLNNEIPFPINSRHCTVGQFSHFCPMGVLGLFILSKYLHCAMYEQV